ncbi:MAG TPA: NAD+ synthase [archaeon]|nr:NAD+ synthase [archaeon]
MASYKKSGKIVKKIQKFFSEQNKTKCVLGLSGGIDSALTLALLVKALGNKNITCILMPNTKITKNQSTNDAKKLAEKLGVRYFIVPIDEMLESFQTPWKQSNTAKANLSARTRALLLYNYANSNNALVAGTGNKSEYYLGYFTKYGDAAADFFPIGNLLKKEVREISKELNLPKEFLEKAPSAELWEGQEDEKELGLTYAQIDELLPLILEKKKIPASQKQAAEKIKKLIEATEHKRKSPLII